MGIFCQINLFQPPDGAYLPGQLVAGLMKYAVDEPMEFEKITTSLKGAGFCSLRVRKYRRTVTYSTSQVYVDIDNIVLNKRVLVPAGTYEIRFSFILPHNLPSSVYFYKQLLPGTVKCSIKYYIRIKFKRSAFFSVNKHFKKEITVIAGATPILLREPVIYGETKEVTQFFSSKPNTVIINATIFNSIIPVGGKINLHYAVGNNSSSVVKRVETNVIERHRFKVKGHSEVKKDKLVPGTNSKTSSVKCGYAQNMLLEINIPPDRHSLENSDIVAREYLVRIEAALPIPHRNAVLDIPIQIEIIDQMRERMLQDRAAGMSYDMVPPSYWVTMGEAKREDDEFEKEK